MIVYMGYGISCLFKQVQLSALQGYQVDVRKCLDSPLSHPCLKTEECRLLEGVDCLDVLCLDFGLHSIFDRSGLLKLQGHEPQPFWGSRGIFWYRELSLSESRLALSALIKLGEFYSGLANISLDKVRGVSLVEGLIYFASLHGHQFTLGTVEVSDGLAHLFGHRTCWVGLKDRQFAHYRALFTRLRWLHLVVSIWSDLSRGALAQIDLRFVLEADPTTEVAGRLIVGSG